MGPTGYVGHFWLSGSFTDTIPNLCPEETGGSGAQVGSQNSVQSG